jgi:NADP-dependent aldehyde dehydrogenase
MPEVTGRSIVCGLPGGPRQAGPQADLLAFRALNPATGEELPTVFYSATSDEVRAACAGAARAFEANALRPRGDRAALLERIADEIDGFGEGLLELASRETGLSVARLAPERDRTSATLRMFAETVREGSWVRAVVDAREVSRDALLGPSGAQGVRPDLRAMLRPLGPVAVFGASNFPLAYSTAGTDTSSALAAGCPVVVKGHPSHPGTGELVAHAIRRAVDALSFDPGTFSFLHSGGGGARENAVGKELVQDRNIRAVGFTGSLRGGMALAELARTRTHGPVADPIPVFAEMGSTNPVFVLPGALARAGEAIADRLFASFTASAGQMCTCPGLIFVTEGPAAAAFVERMGAKVTAGTSLTMLSFRVREGYHERVVETVRTPGVTLAARGTLRPTGGDAAAGGVSGPGIGTLPNRAAFESVAMLFSTTLEAFRVNESLREECFGPSTIVVVCPTPESLVEAAELVQGSLTASVYSHVRSDGLADGPEVEAARERDRALAVRLLAVLERRAGRVIFDGVPTGVTVSEAMVHGGPYPASNQAHATAVGARAAERWCRAVCYQNVPRELLPEELR